MLTTSRERFHDETGTGALGTPTTGVKARVSYAASYFDKADRLTDRSTSAPTAAAPTRGRASVRSLATRCW